MTSPNRTVAALAALLASGLAAAAPAAAPAPAAVPTPAAPAPVPPAPAANTSRLRVSVSPPSMRLAEGGRATVRITGAVEPPLVQSSAGRIEAFREITSGVYEAELVPPDSVDPQLAVVTASSPRAFAWASLVLVGVREVEVKAKHRTLVSVSVGDQSFGPIPADGTGRALVRVDVPPGAHFATSGGRRFPLDVPATSAAAVVLDRPTLDANVAAAVTVRAVGLGERGEPLVGGRPRLQVSEGTISAPREIEPGVFEAAWKVERGRVREAKVTARFAGAPEAVAILERVAGAPNAIEIDVDRTELVAGEGDELKVIGRVVDAAGNATGAPSRLLVSLGTGAGARLLPDAVYEWQPTGTAYEGRVRVPRQRSGRQELELRVLGPDGLTGTRSVTLLPGPPSVVRVEPEEELVADGRPHPIRVSLLDEHGNRAEAPAGPQVTATHGELGVPERQGPGTYRLTYQSPLASQEYRDVVRARFGPLEGVANLHVRARGGMIVVAPKLGVTVGTGDLASPQAGLEVGFWLPQLSRSVGLVLEARWFGFGSTEQAPAGAGSITVESEASFAALEASVAWRRPLGRGMLWLGAGGGVVRVSTTASTSGQPDLEASGWAPSGHASVGWGLPFGPGIPFGELKLAAQGDAEAGAVRGAIQSLTLNVGYRFDVL